MRREPKPPEADPADPLDLSVGFHTRISKEAEALLNQEARRRGIKPATFGRQLLYRGLGLIGVDP